jgi:hypothetical protein
MKIKAIALLAGCVLSASVVVLATTPAPVFKSESVKIPVPGAYFQGIDAAVLNQNCATCHSAGFVNRQPVIAPAAWTGEVTKMKNAFGAPYSAAEIPKIVRALVARQKAGT